MRYKIFFTGIYILIILRLKMKIFFSIKYFEDYIINYNGKIEF
ncbi:protein of unknown function [Candidatus Nitrosocosmicus franklandus]|uniref:Uncharacterized protein n=1 Tax=Candidatus Nitrosocosmicus franklandianus TaxID=1798806 RepID=A0A484I848_9ARCH|nr:protein of unknown function [Candidatus Nitrosocosmicus franklandus]